MLRFSFKKKPQKCIFLTFISNYNKSWVKTTYETAQETTSCPSDVQKLNTYAQGRAQDFWQAEAQPEKGNKTHFFVLNTEMNSKMDDYSAIRL